MITSIFKNSTPINYSFLGIMLLFFFFMFQFQEASWTNSLLGIGEKTGLLVLIFGTVFLANFIVKKNGLTKDSAFTILFYILFLLFFPKILDNIRLVIANFFILLSMRRLVSLQTLKAPKEKIFDAALWIFIASLFHFWAILFILLVYMSIIFHVSRDYRNWLIPFVALFITAILFVLYTLLIDPNAVSSYLNANTINYNIDYFTNDYQNIAFSIYFVFALFFIVPSIFVLSSKPLNLQASYKKVLFAMLISIVIFIISANKTNEVLVFTFLPMAILASNLIEYIQIKIQQELILFISIIAALFCFFTQL